MKLRNIIKYSIILIGVLQMCFVLWYGDEVLKSDQDLQNKIVVPFIWMGVILSISGIVLTLLYFTINLIQDFNPKILYILAGTVCLFIIAYVLASDEVLKSWEKYEITPASSKQVGMGLITTLILVCGAIGAILYSELSKIFSK